MVLSSAAVDTGYDLALVTVTMVSAIGTGVIFQDVKDTCRGLLQFPLIKFFVVWSFCYTLLRNRQKALLGAVTLAILYNVLIKLKHTYPEIVAGEKKEIPPPPFSGTT